MDTIPRNSCFTLHDLADSIHLCKAGPCWVPRHLSIILPYAKLPSWQKNNFPTPLRVFSSPAATLLSACLKYSLGGHWCSSIPCTRRVRVKAFWASLLPGEAKKLLALQCVCCECLHSLSSTRYQSPSPCLSPTPLTMEISITKQVQLAGSYHYPSHWLRREACILITHSDKQHLPVGAHLGCSSSSCSPWQHPLHPSSLLSLLSLPVLLTYVPVLQMQLLLENRRRVWRVFYRKCLEQGLHP